MNPETEKIIKKQIEKLSIKIRTIIADPKLGDKILNIGKKNGLSIEQIGVLQIETYLIMLGLTHIDEYPNELKDHLKIEDLKLNNILIDMDNDIIAEIQDKIDEVYNKIDEDELKEIKESLKIKNPTLSQNLDFVLSGGDYSTLIEERKIATIPDAQKTTPIGTTRKIEDLRSKFTI